MIKHALQTGTSFVYEIFRKGIVYAVIVHQTRQICLIQMEYRLQSMYNHMEGRTASVVSPLYSLLPGKNVLLLGVNL